MAVDKLSEAAYLQNIPSRGKKGKMLIQQHTKADRILYGILCLWGLSEEDHTLPVPRYSIIIFGWLLVAPIEKVPSSSHREGT